ncbi:hypothetical protein [Acetilactobacillus jinshanensis]|uniref:hypothetical protein n=1 Tax=Acetilactobacillus jinshanensis TaxID=1720083 RepID=UPI0013A67208|nr:hypothetical protein [Acetilactobacillus jinshanensis]URL60991.1 hypothetical protein HGK75_03045 [uncultured bacterium]
MPINYSGTLDKDTIAKLLAFEFVDKHKIGVDPEDLARSYSNAYATIYKALQL